MPYLLFISHYSNAEISKMYQDLTWLFIKYRLPVVWTTKCSFSVFCKVIFELCGQLVILLLHATFIHDKNDTNIARLQFCSYI